VQLEARPVTPGLKGAAEELGALAHAGDPASAARPRLGVRADRVGDAELERVRAELDRDRGRSGAVAAGLVSDSCAIR
jgi:hypothetical protein